MSFDLSEMSMASVPAAHRSSSSLRHSSWGGLSSMLRLAANEQRAQSGRHGLLKGLARALRAAGPDARSRPMHALLADMDFADTRLRGG